MKTYPVLLLLLISIQANAQKEPTKSRFWINPCVGRNNNPNVQFSFGSTLTYQMNTDNPFGISARYIYSTELINFHAKPVLNVQEYSLMATRLSGNWVFSGGIGYISYRSRGNFIKRELPNDPAFLTDYYEEKLEGSVGIPLEISYLTGVKRRNKLGLSFSAFGNINGLQSYYGLKAGFFISSDLFKKK